MKRLQVFYFKACPYCKSALAWIEQAMQENPEYRSIPITLIDEKQQPQVAEQYDYYYVPTFYINGEKVHEGVASYPIVKDILRRAYQQ